MTNHADWVVSKYISDTDYKDTQSDTEVFENSRAPWKNLVKNVKFWAHKKVIEIPQWGNQFINDAFHAREQKLHEGKLNI